MAKQGQRKLIENIWVQYQNHVHRKHAVFDRFHVSMSMNIQLIGIESKLNMPTISNERSHGIFQNSDLHQSAVICLDAESVVVGSQKWKTSRL